MKHPVAVAISGGIDSLFSAYLLKHDGYPVTGIHFVTGYASFPDMEDTLAPQISGNSHVYGSADPATLRAMGFIADQLDIPIHIVDLSERFEQHVVSYFVDAYAKGQTPNPCLRCNPLIKFGELIHVAQSLGIDRIATGHYVRTNTDDKGQIHLHRGMDTSKDQAYFLALLSPDQLNKALFPLGNAIKKDVRKVAENLGLKPVTPGESQDICFINDDYKTFLAGRPGFKREPGPIKTRDGKQIGAHKGLHSFTIGQRRGINCPGPFPYYVLGLDTETNSLVVGPKDALFSRECLVKDTSWINSPETFPVTVTARIRYAHKGTLATLTEENSGMIRVIFHEPVASVTPGQGAVFYHDDEVLGGGWIQ